MVEKSRINSIGQERISLAAEITNAQYEHARSMVHTQWKGLEPTAEAALVGAVLQAIATNFHALTLAAKKTS